MRVLLLEDEPKIREVIIAYLQNEGWEVEFTANGYEGVQLFDRHPHDLVLLDLMLEQLSGEEVCKRIREKSQVPIIMITSKTQENDTIRGLNLGADDYIAKPFRIKELVARIHALMRRVAGNADHEQEVLRYHRGQLTIDRTTGEVRTMDQLVHLTRTEYKLLSILVEVPGKIWSRMDLAYKVSGYRFLGDSRFIDTHIKNLRKKIEPDHNQPTYIQTVFGVGYKFAVQSDDAL